MSPLEVIHNIARQLAIGGCATWQVIFVFVRGILGGLAPSRMAAVPHGLGRTRTLATGGGLHEPVAATQNADAPEQTPDTYVN